MSDLRRRRLLNVLGVDAGYGPVQVLRGIDLTVAAGEILGLLGANGSGKSTLLRALTGQLPLWAGKVTIDGVDLAAAPERAKAEFGCAVDAADLPATLTGRQYVELVASIRRCRPDDWPAGDLLDVLSLRPWAKRLIGEYSFGTRVKLAIAAALLGRPASAHPGRIAERPRSGRQLPPQAAVAAARPQRRPRGGPVHASARNGGRTVRLRCAPVRRPHLTMLEQRRACQDPIAGRRFRAGCHDGARRSAAARRLRGTNCRAAAGPGPGAIARCFSR